MFGADKSFMLLLRGFALVTVVTLGLLTILATGGSSGDEPSSSFANAGRDMSVGAGERVKLDGSGSNTPLGENSADDNLTYFWTVVSSPPKPDGYFPFPETYEIENQDTLMPTIQPIIAGEYVVQLRVRFGRFNAYDTVSIFATDGPVPPIARVGPDQFVKDGTLVIHDGSASFSFNEHMGQFADLPFRYSWYINQQPAAANSSLSATNVVNPRFVAEYDAADVQGDKPNYSLYQTRLHVINSKDMVSKPVHVNTFVFPSQGYVYPMPVAGPRQKIISGNTVQLDGSASYDVDGRPLTYNWQFYARPLGSQAVLNGANTATPSFVADLDGIYVVHLQVSNGELSSFRLLPSELSAYRLWGLVDYAGTDRVVITAVSGATAPVTDAGPDQLLPFTGPAAIPLDGSGSYDPNGDPIDYRWYLINSPTGSTASIDTPVDTEPDSASLLADVPGSYVMGLTTDYWERDRPYQNNHVVITLTENNLPTANAGVDQAVSVGDTVILDGSGSSDPDGDTVGYSWSLAYAPGEWGDDVVNGYWVWRDWPLLSDGMAVAPSFSPDLNGEYRLLLTVNDGEQSSVADEVIITVAGSGVCTNPLTLVTGLPFLPGTGESATNIQIDASGTDELSAVAAGLIVDADVYQAVPDGGNPDLAYFNIMLPLVWEEFSRTHSNPISESDSPSFVVRNIADNIYYKINVSFTRVSFEVQIDTLSGCRCGNNAGDCP